MKKSVPYIISTLVILAFAVGPAMAQSSSASTSANTVTHTLSDAQIGKIRAIRSEGEKRAAPLALRLAATAKQIYGNMLAGKEDEQLRQKLGAEVDKIVVELLSIKGQSMREMVGVLTPEQKQEIRSEIEKPEASGDLSEMIMRYFHVAEK